MKKHLFNRILSLVLAAVMVLGMFPAISAAPAGLRWEKSDVEISWDRTDRLVQDKIHDLPAHKPTEMVRVSIVLEDAPTIQAGYATMDIGSNADAMAYDLNLNKVQKVMEKTISAQALGGKPLDVVWNLTLVSNIISANVPYGKIEDIKSVDGVKDVVIERQYEITEAEKVSPDMYTSAGMIGSAPVWAAGMTGAGTRVAIIDTGTDTDHQSFDNDAYLYALEQNAAAKNMSVDAYTESLDLLDTGEIAGVLRNLNVYELFGAIDASDCYISEKLPFGVNYVDKSLDVTHDHDDQGSHGSHVAGIAAANRYIEADGAFADAREAVYMSGVAPDAQIITMKIFGTAPGPTDSDYFAAIEDAILLGCDSINLSLGSGSPGFTQNYLFADLLDYMATTDTVVVISAGNSGYWAEYTAPTHLYADGVSFQTNGSPGTYTNSLNVASVENDGTVGKYIQVGGSKIIYNETTIYSNAPMASLDTSSDGSGTAYDYIFIDGLGYPEDYKGLDLEDKVVFCQRGELSFAEKANVAANLDAAAIVIYSNDGESIAMDLADYIYNAPCVSITQSDGAAVKAASTRQTTAGGLTYYTGRVTISDMMSATEYNSDYYTMSAFSSWGVPGSLELKPEITAPGGMIWSVNGVDPSGTAYEMMSGTSMAAPQVTGMAALVAEYIKSEDLDEKTGLSVRHLAQSLLMSTAEPLREEASGGSYYSILNQGAGLARVDLATTAESYVLVDGMADGKVKAELGDDPARTGAYTFSFSIHNLNGKSMTYALSADVFTQDQFRDDQDNLCLDTRTRTLDAEVSFDVPGGNSVTVPANGSVTVEVTLQLTGQTMEYLNANYPTGAYIEAFVCAAPLSDAEGVAGVTHSIPVLGYYGSWTEPSMYDVGSYQEHLNGEETRAPYLYQINGTLSNVVTIDYGDGREYAFGGNPVTAEDQYRPERNAFNNENGAVLSKLRFTQIRNAGNSRLTISNADSGEVYRSEEFGESEGAYFHINIGQWVNTQLWRDLDLDLESFQEGTTLNITLATAPEYYCRYEADKNGKPVLSTDWDALDEGAYLTVPVTIDNTAPEIKNVVLGENNTLQITAQDNEYVAAAALMNAEGTTIFTAAPANQTQRGIELTTELDLSYVFGEKFLVAVFDYAENVDVYEITLELDNERPYFTAIDSSNLNADNSTNYVGMDAMGVHVNLASASGRLPARAAEYVEGAVFEITIDNKLYVGYDEDLSEMRYLCDLDPTYEHEMVGISDIAFNRADEKLYGLFYSKKNEQRMPFLCTIDLYSGDLTVLGEMPIDANNIAIDGEGNFYSSIFPNGEASDVHLHRYTSDVTRTGQTTRVGELVGDLGYYGTSALNSMAWDHNTDELYWACTDYFRNSTVLLKVNPSTAKLTTVCEYDFMTCGLYIAYEPENELFPSTNDVTTVTVPPTESTLVGNTVQLSAQIAPWNASDWSVTWSSSDDSIATVDENGLVTGVSKGTAVITATSRLDGSKSASCTVTIATLDRNLKGLVRDEDGQVHWASFNTDAPSAYKSLNAVTPNLPVRTTMMADDTLYASTLDADTGLSDLYTVDPRTFEMTHVGPALTSGFPDMAYAPHNPGYGLGVYAEYIVLIDLETGEEVGFWPWAAGLPSDLVGITYYDSQYSEDFGGDMDFFLILDSSGNVYLVPFLISQYGIEYLYGPYDCYIQNIGTPTDGSYFQDFYYDGTYIYWTLFNADGQVELIVWDIEQTGRIYSLGCFPEGVSLVGGLYFDSEFEEPDPPHICPSEHFVDVSVGQWFHEAVDYVVSRGYMNGMDDTHYGPGLTMSRAQFVTVLYRMEGEPEVSSTGIFTDVPAGQFYTDAAYWALEAGITTGATATTFNPGGKLTRSQLVTFMYRYARYKGYDTSATADLSVYRDADQILSYAVDAWKWSVTHGIISGMTPTTLAPANLTNRAQAAVIFQRFDNTFLMAE